MQNGSDSLPFKNAFKNVIFRKSSSLAIQKPLGTIQNKLDNEGNIFIFHYLRSKGHISSNLMSTGFRFGYCPV